jgi:hypothetical protein
LWQSLNTNSLWPEANRVLVWFANSQHRLSFKGDAAYRNRSTVNEALALL